MKHTSILEPMKRTTSYARDVILNMEKNGKIPVYCKLCHRMVEIAKRGGTPSGFLIVRAMDEISPIIREMERKLEEVFSYRSEIPNQSPLLRPRGLKCALRPFQSDGVRFVIAKKGRALIADDMGLGKTIQALAYLQLTESFPALIVCPAPVKWNWQEEIKRRLPRRTVSVVSAVALTAKQRADIVVINYDLLRRWTTAQGMWKAIIFDEVHYLKNPQVQRTECAKKIAKGVDKVIGLSGTPILNRPMEFFTLLNLLRPDLFDNRFSFGWRYCGAKKSPWGVKFDGASNTDELHQKLVESVMIRRLKKDVLPELPDKTRTDLPVTLSNEGEYISAEANFMEWIADQGIEKVVSAERAQALVKMSALRMLAGRGKLESAVEWIDNFLETGRKLIVFANHREVVESLISRYSKVCVSLYGGTKEADRKTVQSRFQDNDKVKLFIGSSSAKEGINLFTASDVLFVELFAVPAWHEQAEDRSLRMGQKNPVSCYYMIARDTIDIDMAKSLEKKKAVVSKILEGQKVEMSIMKETLAEMARRKHVRL